MGVGTAACPDPATMSFQSHGMDLPPSQPRAWSLSVKVHVGPAMRWVVQLILVISTFLSFAGFL